MHDHFKKIVDAPWFTHLVTAVILIAATLIALDTYPAISQKYADALFYADRIILTLFVLELGIRILAHGPKPWEFFKSRWDSFDFLLVATCVLSVGSIYLLSLRVVRLLRVLRLVIRVPDLQWLVGTLLKSRPIVIYVVGLLLILFFCYGVLGTHMFGANDPAHFMTLGKSMMTLFAVVTLEGWVSIMEKQMVSYPIAAPIFFISFILMGTMIFLNLCVGMAVKNVEEAQKLKERENSNKALREEFIEEITKEVDDLIERVQNLPQKP